MPRVKFEDLELEPRQSELLELMWEGTTVEEIAASRGIKVASAAESLARLTTLLLTTLGCSWRHCVAREFLRQQEDIIRGVVPPMPDAEIDRRLAEYAEQDRAKAMAAGA